MTIFKNVAKRMLALTMSFIMVLSLCPMLEPEVHAATVTSGIPIGLTASWSGSGNSLTGSVSGGCNGDSNTLTLTNVSGGEATLMFDYTINQISTNVIIGGTIYTATGSGSFEGTLSNNGTVTVVLDAAKGQSAKITIDNVKLKTTVTFGAAQGPGTYTVKNADGDEVTDNPVTDDCGTEYKLEATPDSSDVTFQGWYSGSDRVSDSTNYTLKTFDPDNGVYNSIYPKFSRSKSTITFNPGVNGSYSYTIGDGDAIAVTNAAQTSTEATGTKYTLTAGTPESGYEFYCWEDSKGARIQSSTHSFNSGGDESYKAIFLPVNNAQFEVGGITYRDLNDADAAAYAGTDKTIKLVKDGILPAGNYTVSGGNTLLIPYDANYTVLTTAPEMVQKVASGAEKPTVFRTLTMAEGATITVNGGSISIGGKQNSGQGYNGTPTGTVGLIHMNTNSQIILENGANLYAWGYITGQGTVEAKAGSTVYEDFQLTDFRGGRCLTPLLGSGMINNKDEVFPMSQYYIQNIEVMLTLHAGATELAHMSTNAAEVLTDGVSSTSIPMISGTSGNAMFRLASGTITKDFNEATGRLEFVIDNGNITVNPINMSLKVMGRELKITSSDFVLPIPGHMSVIARGNRDLTISQHVGLLPGASLVVESGVDAALASGVKVIVYDAEDWAGYTGWMNKPFSPLPYAPGRKASTTIGQYVDVQSGTKYDLKGVPVDGLVPGEGLADASVVINGTIDASKGAVYTTDGGANIYSTGGGKVITTPGTEPTVHQAIQKGTEYEIVDITIKHAVLKNGDGSEFDSSDGGANTYYYQGEGVEAKWICHTHIEGDDDDHKCDICGTDGVSDHVYSTELSFDENNHWYECACGDKKDVTAHSYDAEWKSDETNHWKECACGVKSEEAAHTDETPKDHFCDVCEFEMSKCADVTTDTDHNCDYCGKENLTEHNYSTELSFDENNHWYECDCGDKKDVTDHSYGEEWATSGTQHWHECACGAKSGVADHVDVNAKNHICDICSYEISKCADGNNDHNCDYCGKENITAHDYTLNTAKGNQGYEWASDYSTCTTYGKCSICGLDTSETVDSAFTVNAAATCIAAEYRHYTADFEAGWAESQSGDFYDPAGIKNPDNHASGCTVSYESAEDGKHIGTYSKCGAETDPEAHSLVYSAQGGIITESCDKECGHSATAAISAANATYDGTAKETASVAYSDGWLGGELTVSYANNVNAGKATASITLGGATASVEFTIAAASLAAAEITVASGIAYTGSAIEPNVIVKLGEKTLTDADYDVAYTNNINVGTATVTVTGKGNYKDSASTSFTIVKATAPTIQWPTAGNLVYGQKLSESALTSADTNGTFAWENGNIVPTVSNSGYVVVYTPKDTANYDYSDVTLTKTISVTVGKAASSVTAAPAAKELTYNGSAQVLITAGTTNDGKMVYSLSENGEYSETIPTATNAGEYTVWYYVKGDANHSDSAKENLSITIDKLAVAEPTVAGTYIYTGSEQTLTLEGLESYMTEVSGDKGTAAGSYEAVIALDDNHMWADGSDGKIQWIIGKAYATLDVDTTPITVTYGESVTLPTAISNFGTVVCDMTSAQLVNAGDYIVTYSVVGTDNYYGVENKITVTVEKKAVAEPTVAGTYNYTGSEQTVTLEGLESYMTVSGNKSTAAGSYEAVVTLDDNHMWAEGSDGKIQWSIAKAASSVTAPAANELTYTGSAQALVTAGTTNDGTMLYSLSENGEYSENIPASTNAGEYTIWYYVKGDANHFDSAKASVNVTIAKAKAVITVNTAPITVTYGDTITLPAATSNFGTVVCDKTSADLVNAGSYTVTYTVDGTDNYEGAKENLSITVEKKAVVEPTVTGTYTYTGSEQTVTLEGLESYMTVSGNKHTEAGSYEAVITLDDNHMWAEGSDGIIQWSIAKADASVTVPTANTLTYTGSAQALITAGTTNDGKMVYSLSENGEYTATIPEGTNAGEYTVWYYVQGDANHSDSAKENLNVTIEKKAVAEPTVTGSYIYTGNEQTVDLAGVESYMTVISGNKGTAAGSYEAVIALDDNHMWADGSDGKIQWIIGKAYATLDVDTTPITVTYGESVTLPTAISNFGTVVCDMTSAQLVNAGDYIVTYSVVGTDNYYGVENKITVTVEKKAVAEPTVAGTYNYTGSEQTVTLEGLESYMTVSGNKSTAAGSYEAVVTLDDNHMWAEGSDGKIQWSIAKADASVTAPTANELTYTGSAQALVTAGTTNDGTMLYSLSENGEYSENIPASTNAGEYTVWYYVQGDANHFDSAKASVNVTVAKAKAVITVDTTPITVTYGESVTLPAATSNFGTVDCDKTSADLVNAGSYTVTYTVDGTDNYEGAEVELSVTVEKKAVAEPTVTGTYTYTGSEQTVTLEGLESYMTVSGNKHTEAGSYEAVITLDDNHMWAEGSDGKIQWSIAKADASVTAPTANTLTYTGSAQALITAGTTNDGKMVYSLSENGVYTETIPEGTNAGEYTVWYYVQGDANHSDSAKASVNVTIAKAKAVIYVNTDPITVTYGDTITLPTATSNFGTVVCDKTSADLVNAGDYIVTYSVADNDNYNGAEVEIKVTVEKMAVAEPTVIGVYTYTGKEQTVALEGVEDYMTEVSGNKGTAAGSYEAEITLDDNHMWAEGSDGKIQWSIAKAYAVITVDTTPIKITYGENVTLPTATSSFGDVVCDKTSADLVNAGSYTVTYSVAGTDNYYGVAKNITVTIEKKAVAEPTVTGSYIYTGNEQTVDLAGVEDYMSVSGNKATEAGSYDAEIALDDNHMWAEGSDGKIQWSIGKADAVIDVDTTPIKVTYGESVTLPTATSDFGTVVCDKTAADLVNAGDYIVTYSVAGTDNYYGAAKNLTVTVEKKAVKEPTVTGTYTYTGDEQTVALEGLENYMTEVSGDKGTNVGSYEVEITLDDNHKWADGSDGKLQWSIAKAQADITVDTAPIAVTYGESVTLPAATTNFGTVVCDTTSAELVNAGTYTVTYSVAGTENYEGDTKSVTVTINAKPITAADVALNGTLTYTGTEQTQPITVTDGITYTVAGDKATDAGSYVLTVNGTDNYTGEVKLSWSINKAHALVTNVPAANTLNYTGENQELITAGTAEGGTMQYQLNGGAWSADIPTAKDVGSYTVFYRVVGDANHFDAEVETLTVTIGECIHSGNTNVDDNNCTTEVTCSVCGAEVIAAKDHFDSDDNDHDCDNCDVKNIEEHTPAADDGDCTTAICCIECGAEVIAAKDHFDSDDNDHDCDNCDVKNIEGHTPAADDGDCTTAIYCTECGAETTAAKDHTPEKDDGDCTTDIKCSVCGTVTTEGAAAHTPEEDDGDCTTDIKCSVCGTVTTAGAAAHTPEEDDGDCTTDIKCSVCGTVTTEGAAAHTPEEDDGNCATAIKCSKCGTVTTEAKDHTYDNDCDADCNECGTVREVGDHIYDNDCDTDCNECGDVREVSDHFDGNNDHNCDSCGKEGITPHAYGEEWKSDKDKHWHECACGDKSDEAAHVYDRENLTCVCGAVGAEASVNGINYATLAEAVAVAKDGDTVVLLKNVALSEKLTVETAQKWSFGDYVVTFAESGNDNYSVIVKGDLTIESGKFVTKSMYGIGVTGKLTVNGGSFSVAGDNDYLIGNWGTTVVENGTFEGQYCCVNNFGGTTEIRGGAFSTDEFDSTGEYESCDLFADSGLTVSGGTFSKNVTEYCVDGYHTLDEDLDGTFSYGAHNYESTYIAPTFDSDACTSYSCACGAGYSQIHEGTKLIPAASIGTTRYETLAQAVAAAKDGDTIVLLKDVTLSDKLTVETTQKWSFNGHTVTIASVPENYGIVVKGDLTILGGAFKTTGIYGIGVTGKLTISDGSFSHVGASDYLIGNWGRTEIAGGTFNGQYCCVNNFGGTTEIRGGSFTTDEFDSTGEYESCDLFADAGMTVNGGSFSKDVTKYCDESHHTVDNGSGRYVYGAHNYIPVYTEPTFEADGYTTHTCACGAEYVENGDGTQKIAVAVIGTTKFETLPQAVAAAKDGDTIVLLKDVSLSDKLTVETAQKWSFDGHTVTLASVSENYGLIVKGDLTILSGNFNASGMYGIGVTGKLTVSGGNFSHVGSNDYLIGNWGTTVIDNGSFNGQYCCVNNFGGTTEIRGGTFTTDEFDSTGEYESCDLFADAGLTVNGGNFSKNVTKYCDESHHTVDNGSGRYVYGAHSFDNEIDRQEPNCVENGYVINACACGAEHKETIPSAGHTAATPVWENVVNATVSSAGSYDSVVYCVNCSEELERTLCTIPMLFSRIEQDKYADTTIPETIVDTYDTVVELENAMTDMVAVKYEESLKEMGLDSDDIQSMVLDVTLMYSTDDENWFKADEKHFPENGKLEIIMPVPEGTNLSRYVFFVAHMFTSEAFGKTIGDVEYPEVVGFTGEDGKEYIKFFVTGLSPIDLVWIDTDPCADGHVDADNNGFCDECGKSVLLGDLDLDGDVDAADLTLMARHVAGIELLTGVAFKNADVDFDGDVDATDLTIHARYVARIITEWEEGVGTEGSEQPEDTENP